MRTPIIRFYRLQTRAGVISGDYQLIDGKRVLAIIGRVHPKEPFPIGMIFVRNRGMAKTSKNGTEWAVSDSIHRAYRADLKIDRNSGTREGVTDGEIQEICADQPALRDYLHTVFHPALFHPEHAEHLQRVVGQIIKALELKRNPHRVAARNDLIRSLFAVDALGRRNPPAARAAAAAAIGRGHKRIEQIEAMRGYLSVRTFRVHRLMREIMGSYKELLDMLGGREGKGRRDKLLQLLRHASTRNMRRTRNILEEQEHTFKQVYAAPYLKNARWLVHDLRAAGLCAEKLVSDPQNPELRRSLETAYCRMRQGIVWMFALDFLEMNVITPISMLMEDVTRDQRVMRRAVNAPDRFEIVISRSRAPFRFDQAVERIHDFRNRARRCSDTLLHTRVKEEVLLRVDEALEFAEQDDWREVKKQLDDASRIL
jgi:hypothetical protein